MAEKRKSSTTARKVTKTPAKTLKNATKQARSPKAGKGGVVPPKNRQFGQPGGNPRSNGHWRPEDTLSFQLKKIAKMTQAEFDKFKQSDNLTMAQLKAIRMYEIEDNSERTELVAVSEIMDRTEGKAKQAVEMELSGEVSKNPFQELTTEELRKLASK